MLDAGCFGDIDVAMMAHPSQSSVDVAVPIPTCSAGCDVEFHGKGAHAGSAPERGINALDGIVSAYVSLAQGRQHIRRDERLHAIITSGGAAANIVPDYTAGLFSVRARTVERREHLKQRLDAILNGAALATGCQVTIKWRPFGYDPLRTNRVLADAYKLNGELVGRTFVEMEERSAGGATDMGNVSQVVPAIHPSFGIGGRAVPHTRDFAASATTASAHESMLQVAKALAMTAIDLVFDPALLRSAKREHVGE